MHFKSVRRRLIKQRRFRQLLVGTLMFGVVIAVISTTMSRSQEEFYWDRLFERLNQLDQEIEEVKKQVGYLVKETTPPPAAK